VGLDAVLRRVGGLEENASEASEGALELLAVAMIHRLTRVEAAVSLILVAQEAQTQSKPPCYMPGKLEEAAKQAEQFIAKQSEQVGMKMIRYIHCNEQVPEPRHDRRRKWWGGRFSG
jgi:hypothetical protein